MGRNSEKNAVVTSYGKGRKIEKISINIFEDEYQSDANHYTVESANAYCKSINSMEFESDSWIFAKLIKENIPYYLHNFIPFKFSDLILKLEDYAIQIINGEIDKKIICNAIKSESNEVKSKIFNNMSKNASNNMTRDLESIKAISISVMKEAQEKIISYVQYLIDCGVIISPYIAEDELIVFNKDK